jgi:hypothetical protein
MGKKGKKMFLWWWSLLEIPVVVGLITYVGTGLYLRMKDRNHGHPRLVKPGCRLR